MKKILLSLMFVFGATFAASAQSSGDLFVGGGSNLNVSITPGFSIDLPVTADYFVMDGLSVGAAVTVGLSDAFSANISPRVSYFVTDEIFAMVSAGYVGTGGAGLGSVNASVGYWYTLSDNVIVSPMVNASNLTGDLGIGLGAGISVKL